MSVIVKLDRMLSKRRMSSRELADKIGTTTVTLSRIKCGQIRGLRFSTLYAICEALECQPGDLLEVVFDGTSDTIVEEFPNPQDLDTLE